MTRIAVPVLLAIFIASAAAAQQPPAGSGADTIIREETGGTPLESIADEAAIAGEGETGPADEDPMARTEAEMIESADDDGCTGEMGEGCPGGDN